MKNYLEKNKILIAIVLISFFLSFFYSFYFRIKPQVDAQAYDSIGWNIAQGHGYRQTSGSDILRDGAITRVGPLYEYFLAGIYKVFGHHYEPVWIAQAIMHGLSAWLIYLTAILVFSNFETRKKIGLWAAAIFGFYPDMIEISAMVLTETLYMFLTCLLIYFFFSYFYKRKLWLVAVLALTSGLAALARPPVLLFVPIILFFLYKNWKTEKKEVITTNHKRLLWHAALFLLILIAVFAPWTIRNYAIFGEFMPFGAAGAFNFWIGNYHGGNGEQEPTKEQTFFAAAHTFKELQDESLRQFKLFLQKYPAEFVKLTFLRVNKYFSIIRPMGFWFYQKGHGQFLFLISSAVASIILFITGFGGLIKSIKLKKEPIYYLLLFLIATPLFVFVTVVETRYRFQIYPILAIFAGFFIFHLLEKQKFWLDKILWTMIAIFFANGLIDLMLSWDRFRERLGRFL
ncbi:MAG: hypothetical protein A2Y98_00960 [Candidatus Portnoybacteria bacterium RBG_19FT_COMBO_36_7]|uniref:Glycosyltransferase RgtA/B/C/D-like domain-containing protein n=1 Tax=Candidatus Portnoybacteria bacterium RBG_19FT_COMBO_36_7 TaxID=1801992 RepID=A0A1G2F8N0_9BACT|nr:MAG: hypothetical protein A2Y98_00960 [Candidatus Portnoybacteria bacterium RBG_19FT_COMBO_36_7]